MKNRPLVSIGMPVYNDKRFLSKAIHSLLSQTFEDFELIIADDGSTDGSEEICRSIAASDSRVHYIRHEKNIGISKNMIFLLNQAEGKYFMWAANDDIWDKDFICELLRPLQEHDDAIASFAPYTFINEEDGFINENTVRRINYNARKPFQRLHKLVRYFDDGFGYGLFVREAILNVHFPVWKWINRKCAYNNIYPALCFYLAKGNFYLTSGRPLWFNRLKAPENINHKTPYGDTFIRYLFAFFVRKINLVAESLKAIYRGSNNFSLVFSIAPMMIFTWIGYHTAYETYLRLKLFLKGRINFF